MAFDFFKKDEGNLRDNTKESTRACHKHGVTDEDVKRLSMDAGHMIAMFEHVYSDKSECLKVVSALAGYACHEAVKTNKERFITIQSKDNREYYFGDDLNYYLLEGPYSVLGFAGGYYEAKTGSVGTPDVKVLVENAIAAVGDEQYKIWNQEEPEQLYNRVKECWQGIYGNMTGKYCRNAAEWPILFGIVMQNIMFRAEAEPEEVFNKAMESALFISKMDVKSLKSAGATSQEQKGEDLLYNFYQNGEPVFLSLEDEKFIHTSIDSLRDFLKENKTAFDVRTQGVENKVIHFKMTIQGELTDVLVVISLKPKMCSIMFDLPFKANTNVENELNSALMSYNCTRRFGAFLYDKRDGRISYKTDFPCVDGVKKDDFVAAFIISMNSVSNFMTELKKYVVYL